jgi:hypothetical protein
MCERRLSTYREILPLFPLCERRLSTYREILPLFLLCERRLSTYVTRDFAFMSDVWEEFLRLRTEIFYLCIYCVIDVYPLIERFSLFVYVWETFIHLSRDFTFVSNLPNYVSRDSYLCVYCVTDVYPLMYREMLPLCPLCERRLSTYISRDFTLVSIVWEKFIHLHIKRCYLCVHYMRDVYPFTYREILTFVSIMWEKFLQSSSDMFARWGWGGFAHQKSDGRDWNVRANMCHVQGILNSDKKKVSWSCHRPYSPTAWEIGSSVSPSSVLGLTEAWFGAGPLCDVVSVMEAVRAEVNLLSALYAYS